MHRDENQLSELTHLIYNASLNPEKWGDATDRIHTSMAVNKSILFTPFIGPQHGGIAFPVGFTQESLELWASKFVDKDMVGKKMQQKELFVSGTVCADSDIFPTQKEHQAYLNSPIYREFAAPNNMHHICVGVVFEGSPDLPPVVYSAWRGIDEPAFSEKDKAWLGLLISHISRSMGIMMRLDEARLQKATFQATLDRMRFGVVLLNDDLQVIHLNLAAQAVLDRNDGIRLNDNNVLESHKADTRVQLPLQANCSKAGAVSTEERNLELSAWLLEYKNIAAHKQQHFLHGASVLRKNNRRGMRKKSAEKTQYVLQCAPLPNSELWYSKNESARYAVFITNPQAVQLPGVEKLVSIYGLTATEAKIALEFVKQGSYKDVAQTLLVTENTVRWHIKNIYPKLGIYKLADLVRMVMALGESGV